jgi:sRNA-binding protein
MSVHAVHSSQQVAQAEALSQAQSAQKQASQHSAVPHDTVTISAAAQAKQTASAIGADPDHDGK